MTATLPGGYATAEQITRDQARNFYYGIRLLSPPKRSALCALYALARRIDDIGDGELAAEQKLDALSGLRVQLHDLDGSQDPVLQAVADAARRYPVPLGAFDELIEGVEMDVLGVTYDTFDGLAAYCRRVAGSIGRLCLGVFGVSGDARRPVAEGHADSLGIALQQTNILRDVREDLGYGRIYLPREDLDRFGVHLRLDESGALADPDGALAALIRFASARARSWYDEGLQLLPLLDRRSAACCAAMAGIYRSLLARIEADPRRVFDRRLSLSGPDKARVAVRALAGRPL